MLTARSPPPPSSLSLCLSSVDQRKAVNRARVEERRQRSEEAQQRVRRSVLAAAAKVREPYRPIPDASVLSGVEPASDEEVLELAEACARRLLAIGEEQAAGKRMTKLEKASRRPTWYALFQKIDADANGTIVSARRLAAQNEQGAPQRRLRCPAATR